MSPTIAVAAPSAASAATAVSGIGCADGAMTIVAHTDDDLLFFNPDILHDIEAGRCTRTVFTTAGEAGNGEDYWSSLESGIEATYAQMAGVANVWKSTDSGVTAGAITIHTLRDAPLVSLVFLRIPDGFDGGGSDTYGWESLEKLWNREISLVHTVDGNEWYTRDEVRNILVQLLTNFQPTTVRTQDWTTNPNDLDDHSDHLATAEFARLANERYTSPHTLLAYKGYPILAYPQNVFDPDLSTIVDDFVTFADYDMNVCNNPAEGCPDYPHDAWLEREYLVQSESTKNTAREAGATVTSSSAASTAQSAEKARDGFPSGEPQAADSEWVSNGEGAGAWIQYDFAAPTPIESVTLYDRPDLNQQIVAGSIDFSDGTSVPVGTLPNNGSGHTIDFPVHTVTSIRLNITAVSPTTTNVGIAEFEAWRGPADTTAPTVTASPAGGLYPAGQQIVLTADEPANIYYTTDGSEPTASSTAYNDPVTLTAGMTLRFIGVDAAGNASASQQEVYTVAGPDTTAPTVTASPASGAYPAGQQIVLGANEPADIYYTTDGSEPTASSTAYNDPVTLTAGMTLRFIGVDAAGNASAPQQELYTIAADTTAPTVSASPPGGQFTAGQKIALSANEAATIYYTTDGSTPDQTSAQYTAPLTLSSGFTLKYFAKDLAGNTSAVHSDAYTLAPVGPPSWHDYTGDGLSDLLAATGKILKVYPGNGAGKIGSGTQIASGWNGMNSTLTPGDFDGDGNPDVLARATRGGALWLYPGNGNGAFGKRIQVGWGWNVMTALTAPGDFDGDGNSDVLARDSSGNLWLYPGDGEGGWQARSRVGTGWNIMNLISSGRDFDGDENSDVLARDTSGNLWLYPGNGEGGWNARTQVAGGWSGLSKIASPGDLSGDGNADIVARDGNGTAWLYPGNGSGGITSRTQLATGWGSVSVIG